MLSPPVTCEDGEPDSEEGGTDDGQEARTEQIHHRTASMMVLNSSVHAMLSRW